MKISQSEWEKELERYYGKAIVDGFTSDEMSRALKITASSASVKITQGIKDGKVKFVGYKETLNVIGNLLRRPCYQFIKSDEKSVGHVVRTRGGR